MEMIYFATLLGNISVALSVLITVLVISLFAFVVAFLFVGDDFSDWPDIIKKWVKRTVITLCVIVPLRIAMPNTSEALAILGIGGTIDCLRSSDEAKQLPDNCIKAVNKWLETFN